MKKFFITTPIYYINDVPHIGHSYSSIAADVIARFYRLKEYKVRFLTGVDENSQKTLDAAKKQNLSPEEFTGIQARKHREVWEKLNLTFDDFIRTTEERHRKKVAEILQIIYDKGDIYKGKYEGLYCVGCEAFLSESDLDENGNCPNHKMPPKKISEENYFFKLSKYQKQLEKIFLEKKDFILPSFRKKEMENFLKKGLNDISISRESQKWGIPLPFDPNHTTYVWFDALINYISAADGFWPADLHIMAKDILRFHSIIWPAMLISAGLEIPKKMFAHGFFTIDGEKISKSLGNAISPLDIAEEYGKDALRFFLFSDLKFGSDGDFSVSTLSQKYHGKLANELGNLVRRAEVMINKYSDGKSPDINPDFGRKEFEEIIKNYEKYFEGVSLNEALSEAWKGVEFLNKFLEENKPWELAKNDKGKCNIVLASLLEGIRILTIILSPFLPETSAKIREHLSLGNIENYKKEIKWGGFPKNKEIIGGDVIFKKIE